MEVSSSPNGNSAVYRSKSALGVLLDSPETKVRHSFSSGHNNMGRIPRLLDIPAEKVVQISEPKSQNIMSSNNPNKSVILTRFRVSAGIPQISLLGNSV